MESMMNVEVKAVAAEFGWTKRSGISVSRWLRVLGEDTRHAILVEACDRADWDNHCLEA